MAVQSRQHQAMDAQVRQAEALERIAAGLERYLAWMGVPEAAPEPEAPVAEPAPEVASATEVLSGEGT